MNLYYLTWLPDPGGFDDLHARPVRWFWTAFKLYALIAALTAVAFVLGAAIYTALL